MYRIVRWDAVRERWSYYNSFESYTEASDERERLERIYKVKFEIQEF